MQKLLFKRTLRNLKTNAFRYFALFLLVTLCMFIVISIVGSAESIIGTVNKKAAANHLEDGQFGTFTPLKDSAIKKIEAMGITVEDAFYLDFSMEDESTLRLMKNREKLNLIELDDGHLAAREDEVVLERVYAAAHELSVGDTITIAKRNFQISGVGTSADYDLCLQNMSDMSADGSLFGTAFVSPQAYEKLRASGKALHTQEYCYSYSLEKGVRDTDLKDYLSEIKINAKQINDAFFQEMVKTKTKGRDALTDEIGQLFDGAGEMSNALKTFNKGADDLDDGIQAVSNGLTQLNKDSDSLSGGSAKVLSSLKELESASKELSLSSSSRKELLNASQNLLAGIESLDGALQKLESQVNKKGFETVLTQSGIDRSQLSPDAKQLLSMMNHYLSEVNSSLKSAADGSASLSKNFKEFDASIGELPELLKELNGGLSQFKSAISTLRSEYEKLDSGTSAYTAGVKQLYDGYDQIAKGSKNLAAAADKLAENSDTLRKGTSELQKETTKQLDEYNPVEVENLTSFVKVADNPRIKAANGDVKIKIKVGIMAGVIVLILTTYVISVFVIHAIDQESPMVGALYALGVKRRQLMLHYTMLPILLCLVAGALGTLLGYSKLGISMMSGETVLYFSIPKIETYYNPYLLAYGLLLPPTAAFLVNWIVIRKRLARTALSMLCKEQTQMKASKMQLKSLGFIKTFQIRQFLREKRSCFAVMAGMFISLLILILALDCLALCLNIKTQNAADTKYSYMYQYKYPTETAPEGGYAAYAEGLKKEALGYNMEVSIIGLSQENPYFPSITSERKNEISISSSVAGKYGIIPGDKLILSDEVGEKEYGFTVREVVPYSVGLCCFMEISSMRTLFGKDDGYYNVVYSDRTLDIDAGRLYTTTTKEDAQKSSDIFMQILMPMIVMLSGIAALIFLIVLYQMIRVMIDRASSSISLMKIFGFRDNEIRRLYLDGNTILIATGALAMIPLAKVLMDAIYPLFIANVASGADLTWPPALYFIVYAGALFCYLLIRTVLLRRVKKLTPAEALKDRE